MQTQNTRHYPKSFALTISLIQEKRKWLSFSKTGYKKMDIEQITKADARIGSARNQLGSVRRLVPPFLAGTLTQ